MANRNKTAGSNYERQIRKELIELGYECAVTSRSESKNMDDRGVDIIGDCLPIHSQCKFTVANPKYNLIFTNPKLPKDKPFVLFHKESIKKGSRFFGGNEYVIINKDFFYELIKKYKQ